MGLKFAALLHKESDAKYHFVSPSHTDRAAVAVEKTKAWTYGSGRPLI